MAANASWYILWMGDDAAREHGMNSVGSCHSAPLFSVLVNGDVRFIGPKICHQHPAVSHGNQQRCHFDNLLILRVVDAIGQKKLPAIPIATIPARIEVPPPLCSTPPTIQSGASLQIFGKFDGDLTNTAVTGHWRRLHM